jgi:hypothetical protein
LCEYKVTIQYFDYPHHIMVMMFRQLTNKFVLLSLNNLKRDVMLTTNDVAKVYDTILSIPGMSETVKIDMKISRKNLLLLNSVIKRGLTAKDDDKSSNLLESIPAETLQELEAIADDYLTKAGLTELSEKLKALSTQ